MKRFASFTIVSILAATSLVSNANAASYEPGNETIPVGYASISVDEEAGAIGYSQLSIQPSGPDENLNRGEWVMCESLDDERCDFSNPKNDFLAWSVLPPCQDEQDDNCIEPLIMSSEGSEVLGIAIGSTMGRYTYPDKPEIRFVEAGQPTIFRVPGVIHGGGTDTYVMSARLAMRFNHRLGYFEANDLSTAVTPVTIVPRPQQQNGRLGCIEISPSECGVVEDFSAGVRVKTTVRVTNEVGGWFFGRMKDPNIGVMGHSASNNKLTVDAEPVRVARLNVVVPQSRLTLQDRKAMGNSGSSGALGSERVYFGTAAHDESVFKLIDHYRSWVNDTAAGETSLWSFRTITTGSGNQCFADNSQVFGIVTTNATGYNGNSPSYDRGSLNYRVAGLHYAAGGEALNLGTYDLVMRSDTARCLYGFTKAPVSATVAVLGAGGQETVATTVVSERDGWLKLAAYGFTFSEKEIKVRFTQSRTRTLSGHPGRATALTGKQKSEIRAVLEKGIGNSKFICTGIRLEGQPVSMNRVVRLRAKLACDYAKSLNPSLSTFYQTKTTKAPSFNGRVLVVSK